MGHQTVGETHKYITFKLAEGEYGIAIVKVRELIGMMEITRVPNATVHIRGVIDLRGKIIPVLDLRARFGLSRTESTSQTVIIVVQLSSPGEELTMGILVDEVLEVRALLDADIAPPPTLASHIDASFVLGIGMVEKRVIFLLDIERVLTPLERGSVADDFAAVPVTHRES